MIRFFILLGFSFLFLHLHATGSISKYINMKYSYISFITIFVLFFLTIVQLYFYIKGDKDTEDACDCGCDHHHDHQKTWKDYVMLPVLIFPIFSVLCLPVATLDSNIVKAKGFNFNVYNDKDTSAIHEFLQPDSSVYYGTDGYDELMSKSKKKFSKFGNNIAINDENWLQGMETIYHFPGDFEGKTISFRGFAYNEKDIAANQLFIFRFGIIHCVADSGVFGMLVEFPKNVHYNNDDWLHVTGTLSSEYYQPFKKTIPVLKVEKVEQIPVPKEQYVYRNY